MVLFPTLIAKVLPLYGLIGCGYLAGRYAHVRRETVANLLIYVINPAVIFLGTIRIGVSAGGVISPGRTPSSLLLIPLGVFTIGMLFCWGATAWGRRVWADGTGRLLGFVAGSGNTGYFGLPVCLALFGETAFPVVTMVILGNSLFENTVGYFTLARTAHPMRVALRHVATLPPLHAFLIALAMNVGAVPTPAPIAEILLLLKGAFAPLGMMLVGLGLIGLQFEHVDYRFIAAGFTVRFICWFGIMAGIVAFDRAVTHLFSPLVHNVLLIEALAPAAANTVAVATRFRAHPEKGALVVLLTTLAALGLIPVVAATLLR